MLKIVSYVASLRISLKEFSDDFYRLLADSQINHHNWNDPSSTVVVIGFADYGWAKSTPTLEAAQMALLSSWDELIARFDVLFEAPTPDVRNRIDSSAASVRSWLERDGTSDHSIPDHINQAPAVAAPWFADLEELLDLVEGDNEPHLFIVPDTNALLGNPDLATYERATGRADFTVVLLPPVVSELDSLKDRGNPEVKKKAQAFIRRLKGLRQNGKLTDGVKLTRGITVRALAREVDPVAILSWLDSTVMDDRILAGALSFQRRHGGDHILLVTSDLNLQNKADATGLPYAETPATDKEIRAGITAAVERRGKRERHWVVVLSNAGPKRATDVTWSASTSPDDSPGMRINAGPWTEPEVKKSAILEKQTMFASGPVYVKVMWTDELGEHDASWCFELDKDSETAELKYG